MEEFKNAQNNNISNLRICVTRKELPKLLGCGQQAADRVAREAKATIRVGKRILISLPKLEKYIEEAAE